MEHHRIKTRRLTLKDNTFTHVDLIDLVPGKWETTAFGDKKRSFATSLKIMTTFVKSRGYPFEYESWAEIKEKVITVSHIFYWFESITKALIDSQDVSKKGCYFRHVEKRFPPLFSVMYSKLLRLRGWILDERWGYHSWLIFCCLTDGIAPGLHDMN